ncbi:hypothetical protein T8K17_00030 [Thalassobaculum sp. OXR-137]|nr:hypothetical protein [Thalassobaculum sp. OXR-137]WPZ34534.1 hypothetical protein T8K17_00030 [Thalassobaculum sp. OXR-137]
MAAQVATADLTQNDIFARLDHLGRYFNLILGMRWPVGHLDAMSGFGTSTGYFPERALVQAAYNMAVAVAPENSKTFPVFHLSKAQHIPS